MPELIKGTFDHLQAPDAPLDILGAESEGQIGYLLETALSEALPDSEASIPPVSQLSKSMEPLTQ